MVEKMPQGDKGRDGAIEPMPGTTVSIFGAQGHLGHNLSERLNEIKPPSARIVGTVDKDHNAELATSADLAIIAVQPKFVRGLLNNIGPSLKPDAQVLSFAIGTSLDELQKMSGRPAARAMCDTWFQFVAFTAGKEFDRSKHEFIFNNLARVKSYVLATEKEFDAFSVNLIQLYAPVFLKACGEMDSIDTHLQYLAPRFGIPAERLAACLPTGDPQEQLRAFATPGGVTEAAIVALRSRHSITPEELAQVVLNKIEEIRKRNLS